MKRSMLFGILVVVVLIIANLVDLTPIAARTVANPSDLNPEMLRTHFNVKEPSGEGVLSGTQSGISQGNSQSSGANLLYWERDSGSGPFQLWLPFIASESVMRGPEDVTWSKFVSEQFLFSIEYPTVYIIREGQTGERGDASAGLNKVSFGDEVRILSLVPPLPSDVVERIWDSASSVSLDGGLTALRLERSGGAEGGESGIYSVDYLIRATDADYIFIYQDSLQNEQRAYELAVVEQMLGSFKVLPRTTHSLPITHVPTDTADRFDFFVDPPDGGSRAPSYASYNARNPYLNNTAPCYNKPFSQLQHTAEDWFRSAGTSVHAVANGRVIYARNSNYPGAVVIVEHTLPGSWSNPWGGTIIYSVYSHLSTSNLIGEWTSVSKGQVLGQVLYQANNNSHVHFEMRRYGDMTSILRCPANGSASWPGPGYTNTGVHPDTYGYTHPSAWIDAHRGSGSVSCPAPSLTDPGDGATLNSRTITFRWNALSGCTFNGYTFRVCTSADVGNLGNCFIDTGEGGTQRNETINNRDNQDLWWGVRAANAPNGASWAVRRFRIQPSSPACAAPSLIEPGDGATLNSRTITFRWNALSGCTFSGYTFRVCTSADVGNLGNCFIDTGESGTQRTETISNRDNQDLYWGVRAANAPNGASWSARRFRIQPNSPPSSPSLTSPSHDAVISEGSGITLSWSNSSGATEYYCEYWGGPAGTLNSSWRSGTSWDIGAQWAGYGYSWRCKARNSSGESAWSSTRTFEVRLSAPSDLTADAVSCNEVNLSWSDSSGNEEGFRIVLVGNTIAETVSNVTTYTHDPSRGNTTYTYFVKAFRDTYESDAVSVTVTTPPCPQPPVAPVLSFPTNGAVIDEGEGITLTWNNVVGATAYYCEYWGGPGGTVNSGWQSGTSWTIGSQWGGYSYYWRCRAQNSSGNSDYSGLRAFEVKLAAPSDLTVEAVTCNQIELSWIDSSGNEAGYRIHRDGTQIDEIDANSTSYVDTQVSGNRTYTYTVGAFRGTGYESGVASVDVATPACDIQQPDLVPAQWGGWEFPVVPASITGTSTVNTLFAAQLTYIDWGLDNRGNSDTVTDTFASLYIDEHRVAYYNFGNVQAGWSWAFRDWQETLTTPGPHILKLVVDPDNLIEESDETNNVWERTFNWSISNRNHDFNANDRADILWRHAARGHNHLYLMNGSTIDSSQPINRESDPDWKMVGLGDFNGDGRADILWRHLRTGQNYIYLMDGSTIMAMQPLNRERDLDWKVAGVADFNADGTADILWRHMRTGQNYLYLMNNAAIAAMLPVNREQDLDWKIVGAADFNGDGKADILWRHMRTGQNYLYLMNGAALTSSLPINRERDLNWTVAGVGDFNGDGKADILWRHMGTGANHLYLMNGAAITASRAVNREADLDWAIVDVTDIDGNGRADILWRHMWMGYNHVYLMNGSIIEASRAINREADPGWTIVGYRSMMSLANGSPAALSDGAADRHPPGELSWDPSNEVPGDLFPVESVSGPGVVDSGQPLPGPGETESVPLPGPGQSDTPDPLPGPGEADDGQSSPVPGD